MPNLCPALAFLKLRNGSLPRQMRRSDMSRHDSKTDFFAHRNATAAHLIF
jgi:hypothetical protein